VNAKVQASGSQESVVKYLMSDNYSRGPFFFHKCWANKGFATLSNKIASFAFVAKKHDHV